MAYLSDEGPVKVTAKNSITTRLEKICERSHSSIPRLENVLIRFRGHSAEPDQSERESPTSQQDYLSVIESNLSGLDRKIEELEDLV